MALASLTGPDDPRMVDLQCQTSRACYGIDRVVHCDNIEGVLRLVLCLEGKGKLVRCDELNKARVHKSDGE